MSRRHLLAAIAVAAVALFAGCGGGDGAELRLTEADSGRSVELAPGETLEITLPSNITTGFSWHLATEPDVAVLEPRSSRYNEPQDGDTVGAGGSETWVFRTQDAGTTRLELAYYRPWEPDVVEGRFELQVTVS
jgi:inhibitor of cysteine peptidase